jgi:hypothetical protein
VAEVDSSRTSTQRRRSERVSKSLPVIVRGIDLLGQPFEERTSTIAVNLHGCRYSSKHHLPKNTWITLELPQAGERRNLRARVAWIQRPHSVREFFQIAVELESPANIWHIEDPPIDWEHQESIAQQASEPAVEQVETRFEKPLRTEESPAVAKISGADLPEKIGPPMTNMPLNSSTAEPLHAESNASENPLLQQWSAELERRAREVSDSAAARASEEVRQAMEELQRTEGTLRENLSAQITRKHEEFLESLRSEFESGIRQARQMVEELGRQAEALRAEKEAALESLSRVAQARLQMEAVEAARSQQPGREASKEQTVSDLDVAAWRQRLDSEMSIAQSQWNELLQSSLDTSVNHLVEQLSGRTQEALRGADQKMSERLAEVREPLTQMYSEARETVSSVKSALDQELSRARSSLGDIEHTATRMKEYSAQLESATHDTLNELHRRLENILQAQTEEMNRRAETLAVNVPQRLAPALDSLGHQLIERTMSEVDRKITPYIDRTSELLQRLSDREAEAEQSLRLHRERLRQVSENNQREISTAAGAALGNIRTDFESARREALNKWSEELDASGVRASHAAAESIGRSSEWFQQEARARLQVLIEQTMATTGAAFEEKTAQATQHLDSRLEEQMTGRVAKIHQQLDEAAGEIAGRRCAQIDEAAETAAASFGQVLRRVSDEEVARFTSASRDALKEREKDVERFTDQVLVGLESNVRSLVERFSTQMAEQAQNSLAEGRSSLNAELASALDGYRAQRDEHDKEFSERLRRAGDEAAEQYESRLQSSGDSWLVLSIRRLNEHGQKTTESLIRSADQSLRESCSQFFQGLSDMLRDRATNPAGSMGFTPGSNQSGEAPPRNEFATGANA